MTISLGQSQTLRLGFESGESGYALSPFGDFSIQPVEAGTGSNTSLVLPIIANPAGQPWQGTNFVLTTPVELIATKTMTIDVLSSVPVTFLMKVNAGTGPEAAAQASHNGDGTWQTISFTFNTALDGKAATANGVYNNMVIHPFFPFTGASAQTFYIDNISGPQAIVAPTLSNFAISAKSVGTSFELTAPTTNSAGAFTYTSNNTDVATISGTTVSVVGAGNGSITATQAANGSYSEGTITATFTASNLIIPTIGALTVPGKVIGDAAFDLSAPSSNSAGAFTYTSSNTGVATILGSTVTIVGVGTSTITAAQATSGSYDAGSVTATLTVTVPSAPTPTNAAEDVISIFSNAYTDVAGTDFSPYWGQPGGYIAPTIVGVGTPSNNTLLYQNLTYQGVQFSAPVNVLTMTNLHLDVWSPSSTSMEVVLIGGGENGFVITLVPGQWNSIDIPMSNYAARTLNSIAQMMFRNTTPAGGKVYVDNIYFWKAPAGTFTYYADADGDGYGAGAVSLSTETTAPTGYSVNNTDCNDANAAVNPGATEIADTLDNDCDGTIDEGFPPSTAAPTPPARNAWDVVSLFSGAYDNVTLNELPAGFSALATAPFSVESIGGNDTWKFGGEFLGMVTNYDSGINLTQMETMHIDYWTPDNKIMIAKIVNTVDGGEATTIVQDPVVTGTWRSVDIPMAQFGASLNKSKITQILLDPQLGGSTVYVDNFYFYRAATGAPTPTIGALTVPAKVIGDASFDLTAPSSNSAGGFTFTSSNESVATISGTTVTIVGAGSSIITATQAAAGSYGAGSTQATLVVSLNVAAPTPTIPADRVLSVYSGAAGYGTLADTNFYPNWAQATQYAQVDVVGNPTLRYSNLNYQGIQLGSVLDITSYDSVHVDIYGAGTTAVNFVVINQEGGAGSSDVKREALTAITLNPGWNSVVIPVASLTSITPGFELNRVGQLMFTGSGTIYVDNIFFSKAVSNAVAPTTTAVVNYCKGAVATPLAATGFSGNTFKWYVGTTNATSGVTTYGTALTTAPTPATATVASPSKKYRVSQMLSDGTESPKADITVNVLALPTEALGTITSNTAGATAGTYLTATTAVGQYVGTSTPVSYRIPPFTGTGLTYYWAVPTGVNIVNQTDNVLTVNFLNVTSGIGAVGPITVQAQNASGCKTAAKSIALTKVLPAAPSAIKMTDASLPLPTTGIAAAVTSFAKYMGTDTILTLTATPSLTATSYDWELPTGVTQVSGGNTNVITVKFAGVTSSNTFNYLSTASVSTNVLRIGVKSVNGVGNSSTSNTTLANSSADFYPNSTSTAKLLTLTAVAPAAPSAIKMTNNAVSTTTAVTAISNFIGTTTTFTLTATPSVLASSYTWELPAGVNLVSGTLTGSSSNVITINFNNVPAATTALYIGVKGVNGIGSSVTTNVSPAPSTAFKYLKLTAAIPAAVSAVAGQVAGVCGSSSYPYTITPSPLATSYVITAPAGSVITSGVNSATDTLTTTDLTFTVVYPAGFVATIAAPKALAVAAKNGVGTSANKTYALSTLMPALGTITGGTTYQKTTPQVFSVPTVVGAASYNWVAPTGAIIASGQGTNSVTVDFSGVTTTTSIKLNVSAVNACNISTAVKSATLSLAPSGARIRQEAITGDFNVIAYPNPSSDVFTLEVQSSGKGKATTEVQVYDMIGRLIEQLQVESDSVELGDAYPTGVYNVIVNQGENIKTLRVIKK